MKNTTQQPSKQKWTGPIDLTGYMASLIRVCTIYIYMEIFKTRNLIALCLTRDRGVAGSSLTGITVLCPLARHINLSLVQVQPRKTGIPT